MKAPRRPLLSKVERPWNPIFDDLSRYQVTTWYFQERNLILDWSETRPSTP